MPLTHPVRGHLVLKVRRRHVLSVPTDDGFALGAQVLIEGAHVASLGRFGKEARIDLVQPREPVDHALACPPRLKTIHPVGGPCAF